MQTINLAGMNGNIGIGIAVTGSRDGKESGQVKNGAIYAGNINNMTNDRIEQKRAQARKQATKAIMDQFARDGKVIDGMNELRARNEQINAEQSRLIEEKKGYEQEQEALKEKYGITDDSKEQEDLELIRKARRSFKDSSVSLSKEEWKRIADMGELTEYQQRALGYDDIRDHVDSQIDELENEKIANGGAIRASKQALLETSYKAITKAKDAADAIMDAASDEIIGMLWEEAKKHVDEEMEKLVEAAKEAAEKKEEEEEKLESVKEEKEEQKELTEEIQESAADQEKLQREIDKILKEAELLKEDMKGLMVDGTL